MSSIGRPPSRARPSPWTSSWSTTAAGQTHGHPPGFPVDCARAGFRRLAGQTVGPQVELSNSPYRPDGTRSITLAVGRGIGGHDHPGLLWRGQLHPRCVEGGRADEGRVPVTFRYGSTSVLGSSPRSVEPDPAAWQAWLYWDCGLRRNVDAGGDATRRNAGGTGGACSLGAAAACGGCSALRCRWPPSTRRRRAPHPPSPSRSTGTMSWSTGAWTQSNARPPGARFTPIGTGAAMAGRLPFSGGAAACRRSESYRGAVGSADPPPRPTTQE